MGKPEALRELLFLQGDAWDPCMAGECSIVLVNVPLFHVLPLFMLVVALPKLRL